MKTISILGSTGSIGTQSLDVVRRNPEGFKVQYLTANRNIDLLIEQAKEFNPSAICLVECDDIKAFKAQLSSDKIDVFTGRIGLLEISGRDDIDVVMNGLVGAPGMEPTVKAIEAGVDIALSNKESLVMAGDHINRLLKEKGVNLYPVDSEHSAIWQCLVGENIEQVSKIILTGSGGPFRTLDQSEFVNITKAQALKHPNWTMGNKITIDSATMMKKGLIVIKAHWLFNLAPDQIEIVIHPQSIIHSMVEFCDGSVKAQLGVPDMKIPIQYAMTYPDHIDVKWDTLDMASIGPLTFEPPNVEKFKCIKFAGH